MTPSARLPGRFFRSILLAIPLLAPFPLAAGQARLVLHPGSTLAPLAGDGRDRPTVPGFATAASLSSPRGLAYDAAGNLYAADSRNHLIVRIDATGKLTIVAGNGRQGFSGDGGAASTAELNAPTAVVIDSTGRAVVADSGNNRIRRIDTAGIITTVVGPSTSGVATLRSPGGLAIAADGTLYIADTGNHRVRALLPDGTLTTVAGTGEEGDTGDGDKAVLATFRAPAGLVVLANGDLLIADRAAKRLRLLRTDGTLIAYTPTSTSGLRRPEGLAVDGAGTVLLADAALQQVLQIDNSGATAAAGTGEQGASSPGGATAVPLDSPSAVAAATGGDIAVSDRRNHAVVRIALPSLNFGDVPAGNTSLPQTLTLENAGSAPLSIASIDLPDSFAPTSTGTTCTSPPFALAAGKQCAIALAFAPHVQGAVSNIARVHVTGSATQSVLLLGNGTAGTALAPSLLALQADGSVSYAGAPVTLKATVSGSLLPTPAGTISFSDGTTSLSTAALSNGSVQMSTSALAPGVHSLEATYSGDAIYAGSTSAAITHNVVATPDFQLTSAAGSYTGKASLTTTVTLLLTPVSGTLNRVVHLSVSGLPNGATGTFLPDTATLAGDPLPITLLVKMPATLAGLPSRTNPALPALCIVLLGALALGKRRAWPSLLLSITLLTMNGCGGFRTSTSTTAGTSTPTTFNYTATVTATTTGVLGDTLVHTASVALVVTP